MKEKQENMFEPTAESLFDPQLVESIDIEAISSESIDLATSMCKELEAIFFNEAFMASHPNLRKQINHHIESLRLLIKMRKSDEQIHDINIKAIASNPGNASLYKSLQSTQTSLLSIQRQMDETIKDIKATLRNCQLDINFEEEKNKVDEEEEEEEQVSSTYRGSKGFIEQMRQN